MFESSHPDQDSRGVALPARIDRGAPGAIDPSKEPAGSFSVVARQAATSHEASGTFPPRHFQNGHIPSFRASRSENFLTFSRRFDAGGERRGWRGIIVIYFTRGIGDDARPAQCVIRDAPPLQRPLDDGS